jgi:hypothetical protein
MEKNSFRDQRDFERKIPWGTKEFLKEKFFWETKEILKENSFEPFCTYSLQLIRVTCL